MTGVQTCALPISGMMAFVDTRMYEYIYPGQYEALEREGKLNDQFPARHPGGYCVS